jgi:hypothetical protein
VQRKSRFLMRGRQGIAMFTAIAFLLVMATIVALSLSMTALTTKRGTDLYLEEQAYLLAKSATEYALLAISAHDRNATNNCVNTISITYPDATSPVYNIDTTIRYIGLNNSNCNEYIDTIQTPESNGTVLIDVYVTTANNLGLHEPVRFHRRTMQKP